MTDLKPRFSFGKIIGVESATFSLSRGTRPSVCQVVMPFSPALERGPFPMIWSDGFRRVVFKDCIVNDVSMSDSGNGQSMIITIYDRRWRWQFGTISGRYNERVAGGGISKKRRMKTQDLAKLLLKALGETNTTIDVSRMPNDSYPFVDWDFANAADELQRLCESVNCYVTLSIDNKAVIYRDGQGLDLPAHPSSSNSMGFAIGVKPGKVGYVSAPMAWQFDFPLYPVGMDVDGRVKHINDLSYAPKNTDGDVDWQLAGSPYDLSSLKSNEAIRRLAVGTVYRWYRIATPLVKDIYAPVNKPKEFPNTKVKLVSVDQMLPLLETQLAWQPQKVINKVDALLTGVKAADEDKKRRDPQVWGRYSQQDGTGQWSWTEALPENPDLDLAKHTPLLFSEPFEIDHARGLVKFSDSVFLSWKTGDKYSYRFESPYDKPVTRVTTSSDVLERKNGYTHAQIYLRIACNLWDSDTGNAYRWTYSRLVPGAPDPKIVQWRVRDDIYPESIRINAVHPDGGTYEDDKQGGLAQDDKTNIADVEKQLDYYVQTELKRLAFDNIPGSCNVPQLVEISPDGRLAQVTFEIDGEGAISTTINRVLEGLTNQPDYKERQMQLRLAADLDKLNRQKQAGDDNKGKSSK